MTISGKQQFYIEQGTIEKTQCVGEISQDAEQNKTNKIIELEINEKNNSVNPNEWQ